MILIAPTLYGQAVTVGAVSTGALILFYSKNRYGATPGRAFPHLAYVDKGDAFLQSMRSRKTVLSRRELFRYAARRPNGRDASRLRAPWLHFAGYLPNKFGEFDTTKNPGRKGPGLPITWKTFAKNNGSQILTRRTQGRQKPASKTR